MGTRLIDRLASMGQRRAAVFRYHSTRHPNSSSISSGAFAAGAKMPYMRRIEATYPHYDQI
jgi:hypothetical protein